MKAIGMFGGTFDPVHYGHLRTALELQVMLGLEEIRFVPCADPPHRGAPIATADARVRMLEAAIAGQSGFVVDTRELGRSGPSYSIDTLESLRKDFPDASLCMIVGMDAFLGLPTWHAWRRLLDLAHIVAAHRPGWNVPIKGDLRALISEHRTRSRDDLKRSTRGRVHIEEVTQLEVSSTHLRATIAAGIEAQYLMPDSVWNIIVQTGCYATQSKERHSG
jgi:nicotinate-nucleotide adenylyltransferase